ncbi:hypothetical protein HCU40_16615 [Pseudanabaena biceps]|nr:hypothetical protein [Pseudanabaena biceps]
MSMILGIGCFAIAIGVICWVFLQFSGLAKFIKYFLWGLSGFFLVAISFPLAQYLKTLGMTTGQAFVIVGFTPIILVLLVLGIKYELDKGKTTGYRSTNNPRSRSRIDRDTGRYL